MRYDFFEHAQKIKLSNQLMSLNGIYNKDDEIEVNPVNALRMSIKGDTDEASLNQNVDYIYEFQEGIEWGSYPIMSEILTELNATNRRWYDSINASFTYYNNINNNILKPLGHYENDEEKAESIQMIKGLLSRIKYNFDEPLATFVYNQTTQSYNDASITIGIWLEGFDADNLIGLDASQIKCLLSFYLVEGGNGNV